MNKPIRLLLFVLGSLLVAEMSAGESVGSKPSPPVLIFIVRHAEKAAVSGDVPLSVEGKARAARLAAMLERAGVSFVFSSQLLFAKETADAIAQRHKREPVITPVRETAALLAELDKLPPGAVAVVVNHSGTIPGLVENLTGTKPSPIGENEFDRMFVITRQPGGPGTAVEFRYDAGR